MVKVSVLMAKILVAVVAITTHNSVTYGYPQGAPNCNDGNAALGTGSYHDVSRGLLSTMAISVCIDGKNVNENDTFHAKPNSTYTIKLQRTMNGGIEGIFVRLAAMNTSSSSPIEVIDSDAVLSTTNKLLQISTFCTGSATGITHTSKDRKPVIEITMDTTGLPIDSEYMLGITSVDHHDHSYTPYMIHIMDGMNSTTATNGMTTNNETADCLPIASGVDDILFSNNYYTAILTVSFGLISTLLIA
jgi:hypothetical protein